jgi:hypothetical protein
MDETRVRPRAQSKADTRPRPSRPALTRPAEPEDLLPSLLSLSPPFRLAPASVHAAASIRRADLGWLGGVAYRPLSLGEARQVGS